MKNFTKFRKIKNKGISKKRNKLIFFDIGLIAINKGYINSKNIESSRKVIMNYTKRLCKLMIRIYPTISFTKKPLEMRMGNGKGEISHFISPVKPGKIIFEICSRSTKISLKALKLASYKLPFKTKIIKNENW